jgi:hypothetical protein
MQNGSNTFLDINRMQLDGQTGHPRLSFSRLHLIIPAWAHPAICVVPFFNLRVRPM